MAGIWVRAGTVTLTNGSKKVTGYGTAWNTGTNKVGKGCAFIYNNIEYEVDYVNSDTELYLVDTYSGTTGSGLSYRIQIAVTDTIPELASRIATALAYWNGQAANLQALTTGSGNVTLTAPDGTQVVVPAYSNMQPKDALLTALAALTTTADKLAYFTGSDTVDQTTLTSFARTVLAGADAAAILSTLGAPNLGRTGTGGAPSFRNKIIDGRFDFWYESTSKTYTGTSGYGAETMLFTTTVNDTVVVSQQAVALGEIPSAPSIQYWSKNVVTSVANAASYAVKKFKIEDVRTLAGKTVTFSFYAKADAVRNVAIEFIQVAGTGGSGSVNGLSPTIVTLSTTATRYSVTATLPSINSMTIGTGSDIEVNIWMDAGTNSASRNASLGQQSGTFYFTGVQLEEGSVATPFEELPYGISKSLVSRYYERSYNDSDATGTTTVSGSIQIQSPTPGTAGLLTHAFFKVAKRVSPAVTVYSSEGTVNTTSTSAGQLTADIQNIGCLGFTSGYNSGSSVCYLRFHFVADARL